MSAELESLFARYLAMHFPTFSCVQPVRGIKIGIGGADLMGGSGTILGAVVGAALIEIIRNSLTLLGISTFWQGAFGTFIVVAVAFDSVRRARRNSAG